MDFVSTISGFFGFGVGISIGLVAGYLLFIYVQSRDVKPVKRNKDPRWEEEFQFMVEEPPTNEKLHVDVMSSSSKLGILHPKESLGYIDINLSDVVSNKWSNEKYHLIDSKNGKIQIELQWRTS